MAGSLDGRVALITGAGSGLGAAVARLFAREGAAVVLVGRRAANLARVADAIGGQARALVAAGDIGQAATAGAIVQRALGHFGRLDILVNNAALLPSGPLADTPPHEWDRAFATNVSGPFYLIRSALPAMRRQGYGRIVNVTSGWSCDGAAGYAVYAATKAGLDSMTRSLAAELGADAADILVNAFNPGTMLTEMWPEGQSPDNVAPDILRLATLPGDGMSGRVVKTGERW